MTEPNRPKPRPTPKSNNPPPVKPHGSNRPAPRQPQAGGNSGGNRPQNTSPDRIPSPWLMDENPAIANSPDVFVGFVEYLRWMRAPNDRYKDPTKVQILQLAAEKSKTYQTRFQELTDRTKLMAGKDNTFLAKSTWRLRVGGQRGPESILLPAFDALGVPYLPSSTLRGVARNRAIREFVTQGLDYKEAEKEIAPYFGSIDTNNPQDRSGKVIFFDAYPLADRAEILAVDMANNIWKWGNDIPEYSPNPNPFLSLKESTFLIGIKKTTNCDDRTFDRVKGWLIAGLQAGIGAQINSGYGEMTIAGCTSPKLEICRVKFDLEGQLIHGQQRFTEWKWNDRRQEHQMRGQPVAEVRPIAFKSMLRYWFRAFALGVLPTQQVQTLEGKIFGAIEPKQQHGTITINIIDREIVQKEPRPNAQGRQDPIGKQSGILTISYTSTNPLDRDPDLASLISNLTWIMFHLGGVGQGARRPAYDRTTRQNAPWWRGATLIPTGDKFWYLPEKVVDFQKLFQQRLHDFYSALAAFSKQPIDPNQLRSTGTVSHDTWQEAIDTNCQIIVCSGREHNSKPFALAILHSPQFKERDNYDGNLCGMTRGNLVKPSPVWICDLDEYQVVTIFGANTDPRNMYIDKLRQDSQEYQQIFPL